MVLAGQCKKNEIEIDFQIFSVNTVQSHTRINAFFCISPLKKALDYKLHFFLKGPCKTKNKFPLQAFVTRLLVVFEQFASWT